MFGYKVVSNAPEIKNECLNKDNITFISEVNLIDHPNKNYIINYLFRNSYIVSITLNDLGVSKYGLSPIKDIYFLTTEAVEYILNIKKDTILQNKVKKEVEWNLKLLSEKHLYNNIDVDLDMRINLSKASRKKHVKLAEKVVSDQLINS